MEQHSNENYYENVRTDEFKYYDSAVSKVLDNPFYVNTIDSKTNNYICEPYSEEEDEANRLINFLVNKYNLPEKWIELYENKRPSIEIQLGHFTLYSLREIKNISESYEKYQNEYIDLGVTYEGMGHVCVLSWHKILKKCFYRHDGGGNGWEVEDNFNYNIRYYNKTYTNSFSNAEKKGLCIEKITDTFDFEYFLDNVPEFEC